MKCDGQIRLYNSRGRVIKHKYGKRVTKFKTNRKGYITNATGTRAYKTAVKYQENGMPSKVTVTYKKSDSKLTVICQSRENGKGEYEDSTKIVYTIGAKKTRNKRKYVSMMGRAINYKLMSSVMPEHFFVLGNG